MFPMAAALMHQPLEQAAARFGDRDAVLAGDRRWSFRDLDDLSTAFARHLAGTGRAPRRPRGDDDVEPTGVRGRRPRHQQDRCGRRCSSARRGRRWRPVTRSELTTPVHAVADGPAADLLAELHGRALGHRSRRRCSEPRDRRTTAAVGPGDPEVGERRRGGAGVQLGHDRTARRRSATPTGRSVAPPPTGAGRSASVPTTGSRWPRHRRTSSACSTCWPRRRPAPPCGCTGASTSTRCCTASQSERMTLEMAVAPIALAMANHPDLEDFDLSSLRYIMWGATPVSEQCGPAWSPSGPGVRWLPAYGASEVPVIAANPVDDPGSWRLDSAGLPPDGCRAAGGRSRRPVRSSPSGEIGEIQVRSPSVMAGYLPEEETAEAFAERLVPDRRRRLAGARGVGPPHRPLQGDDQGQRIPGGAGRDRGGTPRASGRARLRGVRAGRRAGRRGAGGCRPARPGAAAPDGRAAGAGGRVAGHLQAAAPRRRSSTPSPGSPRGRCCGGRSGTSGPPSSLASGRTPDGRPPLRRSSRHSATRPPRSSTGSVRARSRSLDDTARAAESSTPPSPPPAGASCGPRRTGGHRWPRGSRWQSSPRSSAAVWPTSPFLGPTLAAELRRLAGAPPADGRRDRRPRPRRCPGLAVVAGGRVAARHRGRRCPGRDLRAGAGAQPAPATAWPRSPSAAGRGRHRPDPARCRPSTRRSCAGRPRRRGRSPRDDLDGVDRARAGRRPAPIWSGSCGVRSTSRSTTRRPAASSAGPSAPSRPSSTCWPMPSCSWRARAAPPVTPRGRSTRCAPDEALAAGRRGQGLLRPGGTHGVRDRHPGPRRHRATPGSAWPTSISGGPSLSSELLGGVGANLDRVLARHGIGGRRWTSVTRLRRPSSASASARGSRSTIPGCPRRRPTTSTGPGRPPGTGRSTTAGFFGATWPTEIGGQGLPSVYDVIVDEELAAAGAPARPSLGYLVEGILEHGNDEIKGRFLPGHRQRP